MSIYRCPVCQSALIPTARVWACVQGHQFDVAKEGYIHLLPVQHKNSKSPGDTAESVAARRAFLQAGHYQPLRAALQTALSGQIAQTLLDIGCGEGYYTEAMQQVVPKVIGIDIAKPAVRLAAKRLPQIQWVVGSAARLPIADQSMDQVCSLFSPLPTAEIRRVLSPNGRLWVATPAPDHLYRLRAGLFEVVNLHEPDKFIAQLAPDFTLQSSQEIRVLLQLDQASLKHLIAMTPYAYKAKPERRAQLEQATMFETEAVFRLMGFGVVC
ncbi:MAG: methyltransferase domain-containing protein [Pseudomonadota bacterium]|nr:methyltransferase domain-containing protein [Pseudomonadota bacterium]